MDLDFHFMCPNCSALHVKHDKENINYKCGHCNHIFISVATVISKSYLIRKDNKDSVCTAVFRPCD